MKKVRKMLIAYHMVDDRCIWFKGELQKPEVLGCPCKTGVAVMNQMINKRILSLNENELIVSIIVDNQPKIVTRYNSKTIESVTVKLEAFGLIKKLIIIDKAGNEVTFIVKTNDDNLNQIVNAFK